MKKKKKEKIKRLNYSFSFTFSTNNTYNTYIVYLFLILYKILKFEHESRATSSKLSWCANALALLIVRMVQRTRVTSCISACAQTRVNSGVVRTRTVWIMRRAITRDDVIRFSLVNLLSRYGETNHPVMDFNEVKVNVC